MRTSTNTSHKKEAHKQKAQPDRHKKLTLLS
jgi:hypothetical protein